jgi:hypothetical protein
VPNANSTSKANIALQRYVLGRNLFVLGSFESGVTIYSQQVRALNLAWAMTKTLSRDVLSDVAVIGGGFAGITFAAALAKKGVPNITIFEKRPVLFPLQQGSDTRWVHPHIYEWPAPYSELPSAELPIINWNAGRASDVVAQVSREWSDLRDSCARRKHAASNITEILGAKYVQLGRRGYVTWTSDGPSERDLAGRKQFSATVLALGYGEEKESRGTASYWRNESLGQPELTPGTRTFLISGYGDGALVDLFRVRLVQFRQDRILDELFVGKDHLKRELRTIYAAVRRGTITAIDDALDDLFRRFPGDKDSLIKVITGRLRTDTAAILHVRSGSMTEAFRSTGASFQNKVMLYLLFCAGAFTPAHRSIDTLVGEYGISEANILRRHGTRRKKNLSIVLSPSLPKSVRIRLRRLSKRSAQNAVISWEGGYWDQIDVKFKKTVIDEEKARWRKEYLPDATELMAGAFCSSIAALISGVSTEKLFRVTLHRIIEAGGTPLLQQACEYFGTRTKLGDKGRTFGLDQGIIGLAYNRRLVCRTRPQPHPGTVIDLRGDVAKLKVGRHAQKMAPEVRALLAVPIIAQDKVCMVLFVDSEAAGIFQDSLLAQILSVARHFSAFVSSTNVKGIRNFSFSTHGHRQRSFRRIRLKVIEILNDSRFRPPTIDRPFDFNFEVVNP